jgi:hypothetical protein
MSKRKFMPDDPVTARDDAAAYLNVRADAYELRLNGKVIARLDGGSAALLPGAGALRDIDIETAIERSEDWLMPFSKLLSGLELRVRDETGRLREVIGEQASFTAEDVEQVFTRVFDAVGHGREIDRYGVADVVLVRELVHHGRVARVRIDPRRVPGT